MKEEREKKKGHGLGSRAGVEDDRGVRGERCEGCEEEREGGSGVGHGRRNRVEGRWDVKKVGERGDVGGTAQWS